MTYKFTTPKPLTDLLKPHPVLNENFNIYFEKIHDSSGTVNFERKADQQQFKAKFLIVNVTIGGRRDILTVLTGHKFHFIKHGVVQNVNYFTCQLECFADEVYTLYDIY